MRVHVLYYFLPASGELSETDALCELLLQLDSLFHLVADMMFVFLVGWWFADSSVWLMTLRRLGGACLQVQTAGFSVLCVKTPLTVRWREVWTLQQTRVRICCCTGLTDEEIKGQVVSKKWKVLTVKVLLKWNHWGLQMTTKRHKKAKEKI